MHLGECFYDHLARFLREPARQSAFSIGEHMPSIQILEYDRVFDACRVFCSFGLTHYHPELNNLCEVMLPIDAAWDAIPTLLANALNIMITRSITLVPGMALGGLETIDPHFVNQYHKHALYFSFPFDLPDGFATVDCETCSGHVYLAAFISQSEYDYLIANGPEQFETILEAQKVDPYHLQRASCI